MGATWQTAAHRAFIEDNLESFTRHSTDGTTKVFWPPLLKQWFERWPLPEPTPELIEKEGGVEKAKKTIRNKETARIKRVFKSAAAENELGGKRKLHLEDPPPRVRSEVQIYMSLYYDERIRATVQERWAAAKLQNMDFSREEIPEDEVDPEDSALLKDTKIPLFYKNLVAQQLYDVEEERIKDQVKATRDAEGLVKTVYNTNGEERQELVRGYQKNINSLRRSIVNILKNANVKCAAKGIVWLACPTPSAGGRPVGQFHCIGSTPDGKDFEQYIGPEKTSEMHGYFSGWMHEIIPPSDWPLFTTDMLVGNPSTTNASVEALSTSTTEDEAVDGDFVDAALSSPNPPELPTKFTGSSAQSTASFDGTTVTSDDIALLLDNLVTTLPGPLVEEEQSDQATTQSVVSSTEYAITRDHSDTTSNQSGASVLPLLDGPSRSVQDTQESEGPPHSFPDNTASPSRLLVDIVNEPEWMSKRKTLDYFRTTFKLGRLADVINRWYELERVLGFPEVTPPGFLIKNRPKVVQVFYKNAHNYHKNYGVNGKVLGEQIMKWWEEIISPGAASGVRFGGPTGIYSLVVLMTWWCSLLKMKPVEEHTHCISTIVQIDYAFITAIDSIRNGCGSSSPPSSQPRKRPPPKDTSARKRLRSG